MLPLVGRVRTWVIVAAVLFMSVASVLLSRKWTTTVSTKSTDYSSRTAEEVVHGGDVSEDAVGFTRVAVEPQWVDNATIAERFLSGNNRAYAASFLCHDALSSRRNKTFAPLIVVAEGLSVDEVIFLGSSSTLTTNVIDPMNGTNVMRIRWNRTFVRLPFRVDRCSLGQSPFEQHRHPRDKDEEVWIHLLPNATLDRSAFVVVPSSVLSEMCALPSLDATAGRTIYVSLAHMESGLPAQFPRDLECTSEEIEKQAATRQTTNVSAAPRMAVHVGLYWTSPVVLKKKTSFVQRMIEQYSQYPFVVDVYVHINRFRGGDGNNTTTTTVARVGDEEEEAFEGELLKMIGLEVAGKRIAQASMSRRSPRRFIVFHEVHESPYFLPWKARSLIKHQKALYDVVMFTEDDMDVTAVNMDYFCRYKNAARSTGFYLAFFRVEFGRKLKTKVTILSDVLRFQKISVNHSAVVLREQPFAVVEIQVYHAFWIADRFDLYHLVEHPQFLRHNLSMQPLILEDASCLQGPMMLDHYAKGKVVPVNTRTMMLHDMCQVWHMGNNYIGRGMQKLPIGGRIEFVHH